MVHQGSADKLFINTAGVGIIPEGVDISGSNARPKDKVILSGTIGDHDIAVLSQFINNWCTIFVLRLPSNDA